jgi:NADP-dependent 3-hydroxy acid dehydrogenase YdfG
MSDTDNLLRKYAGERATMASTMRSNLNANLEERVAYMRNLLKNFNDRLAEIHGENKVMAETLRKKLLQSRKDLSASDAKRMEEFDKTMSQIRQRVGDIQTLIANMLNNLGTDRMQAATEWESLTEAIARIKNSVTWMSPDPANVPTSEQSSSGVKGEEEGTNKNEKAEEAKEKKEEETDALRGKNLEEKIILYVNAHPEGVKVSEMEEPLGEQRMRIGYVCKKLVDEGKIIKLDRAYFPKIKS